MFTHVSGIPATFRGIIHLQTREFGDISVLMTHFLIVHKYVSPSLLILVLIYLSKFTRLSQSNKHTIIALVYLVCSRPLVYLVCNRPLRDINLLFAIT